MNQSRHLDAVAIEAIVALAVAGGVLAWILVNRIPLPRDLVIANHVAQFAIPIVVICVLAYLVDQGSHTRWRVAHLCAELEESRAELDAVSDELMFTRRCVEQLGALPVGPALDELLDELAGRFDAHAAAIVDDDIRMFVRWGEMRDLALEAVCAATAESVRRAHPIALRTAEDGSTTLAVPLQAGGEVRGALCVWRHADSLADSQLDALRAIAGIVELGR